MKVGISIPNRPQFNNEYWCLQRKFSSGFHVIEINEAQLAELKADAVASVIEGDELQAKMGVTAVSAAPAKPEDAAPAAEAEKPGKPMKRG